MHPARFAHHSLDAFGVIREALRLGDAIARALPRGYSKLADQLRRALLGAYLQFTEAAAREGADRSSRLRCARAEAGESAAALEAAVVLGLTAEAKVEPVIVLLDRFCAMVTRLGGLGAR
jgi:four helix bundle protein